MALVIRMKVVSRFLLFAASFVVWLVILTVLNDAFLNMDEFVVLGAAGMLGVLQTWILAFVIGT